MPSHLDDPKKADVLNTYRNNGGDEEWIKGNLAADKLAEKGAALAPPDDYLLHREKFKLLLTRTTQRMMVHIWATHKGYIEKSRQDASEVDLPERQFGLPDPWEEEWDPFETLFTETELNEGLYHEEFEGNMVPITT